MSCKFRVPLRPENRKQNKKLKSKIICLAKETEQIPCMAFS